jgi:hypothetical protein
MMFFGLLIAIQQWLFLKFNLWLGHSNQKEHEHLVTRHFHNQEPYLGLVLE